MEHIAVNTVLGATAAYKFASDYNYKQKLGFALGTAGLATYFEKDAIFKKLKRRWGAAAAAKMVYSYGPSNLRKRSRNDIAESKSATPLITNDGTCASQNRNENVETKIKTENGYIKSIGPIGGKNIRVTRNGRWNPCPKDPRPKLYKMILPMITSQQMGVPTTLQTGGAQSTGNNKVSIKYMPWLTTQDFADILKDFKAIKNTIS